MQLLAHLWRQAAECELQLALVGNDVVLRAGVDRADGDDRRVDRLDFAADDRLQIEHEFGGDDDRVDRRFGARAVAAAAFDRDVDAIDIGEGIAGEIIDFAGGDVGRIVKRDGVVGAREACEDAVVDHGIGAAADFFGRLKHEDDCARPFVAVAREVAGDADEVRHVDVVPAGVHDADGGTVLVFGVDF